MVGHFICSTIRVIICNPAGVFPAGAQSDTPVGAAFLAIFYGFPRLLRVRNAVMLRRRQLGSVIGLRMDHLGKYAVNS